MGELHYGLSASRRTSPHTRSEFSRESTLEEVERSLSKLSLTSSQSDGKACYVFGMGKQPKDIFIQLARISGVHLIFFRSTLPWYLRFLGFIIASYEGLMRIEDRSKLPMVFLKLVDQSMAGVYFLDKSLEGGLVRLARSHVPPDDLGVKDDPGYVYYVVDADNSGSSTGVIEIVSYGRDAPAELIPL